MTFTYDLGTNAGIVRLNIGDTDSNNPVFTDAEITAILNSAENDTNQATGRALLIIANEKSRLAKIKKAGNYSEDTTKIADSLRKDAQMWFERGVIPYDDVMEQTFGPLVKPLEGPGEKEFIEREHLRDS